MSNEKQPSVRVFTKPADPDCYPDGLARSVHFSVELEGVTHPLNHDYGILFAKGYVSEKNTIVPMGVRDPRIFRTEDGQIGVAAVRVHEDGSEDEGSRGSVLLWETDDLIRFEEKGLTDPASLPLGSASDELVLDRETAEKAVVRWSPVVLTDVSVPETVTAASEEDLKDVTACLTYSDGSSRTKKVSWNTSGVDFGRSGSYRAEGTVSQRSYSFPLAKGYGDPVVFPWEGKWYYISTNDNLNDSGLYLREADDVSALFADGVEEHLILPYDESRSLIQTFWAPEFHVIGGELYILFAVSGEVWGPQCHLMKLKKGCVLTDPASWEDPVRILKKDGSPLAEDPITLDMTFIRGNRASYYLWSYREGIRTPYDSGSMILIATVDEKEPWKLTSDPVLLTRPLYGWENVRHTINNEGPYGFRRGDTVYVTYSGGAANGYTYAVGLLTANADSDLLDPASWEKSIPSVLNFRSVKGEYGPGHNSFYTDEDGDLMIVYHAETALKERLRCNGIRRVHFRADGTPDFQMSSAEDLGETQVSLTVIVP